VQKIFFSKSNFSLISFSKKNKFDYSSGQIWVEYTIEIKKKSILMTTMLPALLASNNNLTLLVVLCSNLTLQVMQREGCFPALHQELRQHCCHS
jgi:hypothetical protein